MRTGGACVPGRTPLQKWYPTSWLVFSFKEPVLCLGHMPQIVFGGRAAEVLLKKWIEVPSQKARCLWVPVPIEGGLFSGQSVVIPPAEAMLKNRNITLSHGARFQL
jgi:hypothetical protein